MRTMLAMIVLALASTAAGAVQVVSIAAAPTKQITGAEWSAMAPAVGPRRSAAGVCVGGQCTARGDEEKREMMNRLRAARPVRSWVQQLWQRRGS